MSARPRFFARRGPGRKLIQGGFTGLVVVVIVLWITRMGLIAPYEVRTIDARLNYFADPENASKDISVLLIDEATVKEMEAEGRFLPLPRNLWGDLVLALHSLGAKAVVFDFTFKDKRESHGAPLSVDKMGPDGFSANSTFGSAAWTSGRVVVGIDTLELRRGADERTVQINTGFEEEVRPYFDERIIPVDAKGIVPEKLAVDNADAVSHVVQPEGFIVVGTRALGYVDTFHVADRDGGLRRFAPVSRVGSLNLVDLALAGLIVAEAPPLAERAYFLGTDGQLQIKPGMNETPGRVTIGDRVAIVGDREIPLNEDGTTWIRWRGRWQRDDQLIALTHSAAPVLRQSTLDMIAPDMDLSLLPPDVKKEHYDGKIVLIGFTYQGESSDLTSTPFGVQPGVFKYAATLDTILTQDYLRSPSALVDTTLTLVIAIFAGALVLWFSEYFRRRSNEPLLIALGALFPGMLVCAAYTFVTLVAFRADWVLNELPTLFSIGGTTLVCAVTVFAVAQRESLEEQKRKEHFFNLARQGLGPQVVDELMKGGEDAIPKAGGQRKNLTLYFSDIAGFTTISEKLEPIQLVEILNEYFERVSRILVNKHHGYLDKFIGDAVMASWGSFGADPEAAIRACRAALDARDLIEEFSSDLVRRGIPPLKTRIGLNSGTAVAAWVGLPGQRWSYTAFGDTVNLASRLEGANKAYGTTIMIGPLTFEESKHAMVARELDLVRVKGKKIPVRVYELMGRAEDAMPREREIKRRYEAALMKFRAREFAAALSDFETLVKEFEDSPSKTYVVYCAERLKDAPPADWDGSNELHEK